MNDFTKDELDEILFRLSSGCDQCFGLGDEKSPLYLKVKDMYDNYETIKITKRKCPICSSEFGEPYLSEYKQIITECSNEQCTYFHGFGS
jgi:hypothetical protein